MKVGSLVYATDQGLGILAKAFYDHGVVTDVMVVRHGRHSEHDEWYPGSLRIGNLCGQVAEMKEFCESMDAMMFFETPFVWGLIDHCRAKGVKTALMVMHECLHERAMYHRPDLFLCPSHLDYRVMMRMHNRSDLGIHSLPNVRFIPVPVETTWRRRERAEVFVHNAGWGGLKGRNGTKELMEALGFVKSPARFIVRSQKDLGRPHILSPRFDLRIGTYEPHELYAEGDVFVFPEKFNGLSLPLQEARASGMLVMCGDRFPMNEWLPREPLIPVAGYRKERIGPPYNEYDCAVFDPRAIAAKIDEWYGRDISEYSEQGRVWAGSMSWEALKPQYIAALEGLL